MFFTRPLCTDLVRLSKRMSELNLCSRRQADKLISNSMVYLQGKLVDPVLGQKVDVNETDIKIQLQNGEYKSVGELSDDKGETVVLNKPKGFVSSQPETNKIPAVRLLSRENIFTPTQETKNILKSGNNLHFGKRFHDENGVSTLMNYAPAGRLDEDSSGLLIFTKNGVHAKNILTLLDKEYLVKVEPAQSLSRREVEMGMTSLPYPPKWDLTFLKRKGNRLWNDAKALKPAVDAEWIEEGKDKDGRWNGEGLMRIVLNEGKKRQIRRMCRELLGLHVVELKRIRIGDIHLKNLPVGKWRPLTRKERESLIPKD